jgi:hypothetical protein
MRPGKGQLQVFRWSIEQQVATADISTPPGAAPPASTESAAPRKPRIFCTTPMTGAPTNAVTPPTDPAPTQRSRDTRPKERKIPKSAHGRAKTLTTYGMTVEDVAELYGVPASAIARIVAK